MSRTRAKRDMGESGERYWGREGEIGTLFPVIAADFPDVICHSKEDSGDQMFRLNMVEWLYIL